MLAGDCWVLKQTSWSEYSWGPAECRLTKVSRFSGDVVPARDRQTFREETSVAVDEVATQKPSVAELVVPFD